MYDRDANSCYKQTLRQREDIAAKDRRVGVAAGLADALFAFVENSYGGPQAQVLPVSKALLKDWGVCSAFWPICSAANQNRSIRIYSVGAKLGVGLGQCGKYFILHVTAGLHQSFIHQYN